MAGPNRGMPATHRYTDADLRPVLRDPRCNPQFPLANYWPVYLGNFYCEPYSQHAVRIQEYFGSKGLLARMVFGRNEVCDPYFEEQRRCKLYDFLVYFVSQQDAQDAVYYCNRDMYYGHRLNVLPGRMPAPFDISRSVKHTLVQPDQIHMTEQIFERHINIICGSNITCVVRHSREDFLVQYASVEDRNKAIQTCQIASPGLIAVCQAKQRFLEQNIETELMVWIEAQPWFMKMLPPHNILQALFNGRLPDIGHRWEVNRVKNLPKISLSGNKIKTRFFSRRVAMEAMRLFGLQCTFKHTASEEQALARKQKKVDKKDARVKRIAKRKERRQLLGGGPSNESTVTDFP